MTTKLQLWTDWAEENDCTLVDSLEGGDTAENYIENGISPEVAKAWAAVGGFDADGVADLIEEGYFPDDLSEQSGEEEGLGCYVGTYAYKYCNGDLTLSQLDRLMGKVAA